MGIRKRIMNRMLCVLFALVVVCGMVPAGARVSAADSTKPDTKVSNGKALFDLEKSAPAELEKYPDNVYDVDQGEAFLLSEQNELGLFVTKKDSKAMFRMDNLNMAMTKVDEDGTTWVDGVNVSNTTNDYLRSGLLGIYDDLTYAQSVGFDYDGTGRREYIATVGLDSSLNMGHLVIQNMKTGAVINTPSLGEAKWMENQGFWYMDNYFAITSGDYDGDGKESVIVCMCGDGEIKIYEFNAEGTSGKFRTVLSLGSVLKNTTYKTSGDLKDKPVVGLATGDFDGDGKDQLAFSVGYYNNSGSVKDGFKDFACDNLEQFATVVGIMDCGKDGWTQTYSASLYDKASKGTLENGQRTYPLTILHAGMIAAGDVNNDGLDEIITAGYLSLTKEESEGSGNYARATYNSSGKLLKVSGVCNWSDQLASSVIYRSEASKEYLRTDIKSFRMPEVLRYNFAKHCRGKDPVFARLAMTCGKTNGNNSNEDVFISGVLYDFSEYAPTVKYAPGFSSQEMGKITGGSGKESSVNWVKNVVAANFDQNDAGREQFVFTLWGKEIGAKNYSANAGVITGADFDDKGSDGKKAEYGSKDVVSYGEPACYACNLNTTDMGKRNYPIDEEGSSCKGYTQILSRESTDAALNAVPVAVDIDNDGLMGRFSSKGYVYTDPDLLAVLEAGPYYEELDALEGYSDPCGTSYCVSTGYGTGTSTGDNVSFEAGVALEAAGPCIQTSLEMGYAMEWSHTYEKNYTITKKKTFAAQEYDTVVLSRVPVLVYTYDLFQVTNKETGEGKWISNGYNVRVPLSPRYFMLSVEEYNRFVTKFNKMVGDDGNKLIKIEEDQDLPAGHEGVPDNYWHNLAQAGQGAERVSDEEFALSYNSGFSSSEREDEEETTVSEEMSHGFHYSLTVQGGGDLVVGEAWAGGYVNLDYSHSKGTSKTKIYAKGTAGQVQNLNKKKLMEAGMTEEQVEAYAFTWQFIKWTRPLTEDGTEVPFYGYIVYDYSRPEGRPSLSGRTRTEIEDGYQSAEINVKVGGDPAPEITFVKGEDRFSLVPGSEEGTYRLVAAPALPIGTHKVILRAENIFGAAERTFTLIVTKSADQQKAEKVSGMIRKLELYELDMLVENQEADQYEAVYNAYQALTEAQRAYLTDADILKMDAAMTLAQRGEKRRTARDRVFDVMEQLDRAGNLADVGFLQDEGLQTLKENAEARDNFLGSDYPNLVETISAPYDVIFSADEYLLEVLWRDHQLRDRLDYLRDMNERITRAYNYARGRFDQEALDQAYNESGAEGFDEEISRLDGKSDRTWKEICELWQSYLQKRKDTTEADNMALLRNMEVMYGMLEVAMDTCSYQTEPPAGDLYGQADVADQATDVASVIDDLPRYDEIKYTDEETIAQARAAYENLSPEQKAMLGDRFEDILKAAEECVAVAVKAHWDSLPDISKKAKVTGIPASYVYDGKYKKPAPVLTVGSQKLVNGTDYTVTYKSNKYVGKATVTIKGIGDYKGTVTKTFKILPKSTTIKKLVAKKKGFTVKWNKQAVQTTGYQIQYSLKKNFKGAKTITITGTKTVSKKVSKLKAKKKYYVRIRTFKTVNKVKYYSSWSKAKAIKTKKTK